MVLQIKPRLKPDCKTVRAYCDMNAGGYTVIQRRMSGELDFYRNSSEYKQGFGEPSKEYWLGLDMIHYLTHEANNSLRIEMEDWDGRKKVVTYDHFTVASEQDNYELWVQGFAGDAGDSLSSHVGMKFSTFDTDHDRLTPPIWGGNCAQR